MRGKPGRSKCVKCQEEKPNECFPKLENGRTTHWCFECQLKIVKGYHQARMEEVKRLKRRVSYLHQGLWFWTAEQMKALIHSANMREKERIKFVGKSEDSVRRMSKLLGIVRTPKELDHTLLAKIYYLRHTQRYPSHQIAEYLDLRGEDGKHSRNVVLGLYHRRIRPNESRYKGAWVPPQGTVFPAPKLPSKPDRGGGKERASGHPWRASLGPRRGGPEILPARNKG